MLTITPLGYSVDWSRTSTNNGYRLVYAPDHPRSWSTGYIYEHIIVAEQATGRLITRDENVHHRDHDRQNNDSSNLSILKAGDHTRHHNKKAAFITLTCAQCGATFQRRANQRASVKGYRNAYCTKRCNGIAQQATLRGRVEKAPES